MTPVDHDASPIAWREAGTGDLVLFLHGLGGSRLAWEAQLDALSAGWRCVAWDMPGYGCSDVVAPLAFEAIADAAAGLIDTLGVQDAHIVGLSFGGQQALHLALRHPDRVRSLVLADTSAVFGGDGTDRDEWVASRLGPIDDGLTPAELAPAVLGAITAPGFAGLELERARAAFDRIGVDGFRAAVHCLPDHDVLADLGRIDVPTLVIVGELDDETPLAYSEVLADRIADATLEIIPGVGHLTPSEAPITFNALVRTFLDAQGDGTV